MLGANGHGQQQQPAMLGANGHGQQHMNVEEEHKCPCHDDVEDLCGEASSAEYAYEDERHFAIRMCLLSHKTEVSEECTSAIADSPSIAEACYEDISETCNDVVPGNGQLHACLMDVPVNVIQPRCAQYIMDEIAAESAAVSPVAIMFGILEAFLGSGNALPPPTYVGVLPVVMQGEASSGAKMVRRGPIRERIANRGRGFLVETMPVEEESKSPPRAWRRGVPEPIPVPEEDIIAEIPEAHTPESPEQEHHEDPFFALLNFCFTWALIALCVNTCFRCCRGRKYEQTSREEFEAKIRPSLS
jgi:hypothetical protein